MIEPAAKETFLGMSTCGPKMGIPQSEKIKQGWNRSVRFIYVDGKRIITDGAGRVLEFGNSGKA